MLLNPALAFAAQQTHILHNEKPRPSRCAEVCAVCGDFSTGYHYEVPSCNGCKTFFRRTIVSERVFKCHKNGNCLFNKDIRCACRACRFKKCLEVGMNPKAIQCNRPSASLQVVSTETKNEDNKANVAAALTASEHAIRKRAYDISSLLGINEASCSGENENMHKLPSDVTDSDSRSGYCSSNGSPRPSKVSRSGTEYDQLIETLLMYEGRAEFLRNSDFEPSISLLDTMTKPCGLDDVSKYTTRSRDTIHTPDYWLDMEITICLEYAKAFETYKNLSIADKCVLINETCLASALISLTYSSFLRGSSTLTFPDGSPMQLAGLGSDYFTSQLLEPLTRLRADQVSVTLLKCIIFLHGEGYGLSEEGRLAILSRRERYYDALMTHVFAVHGPQKGPGEMCDLLALSWKYFNVAARIRDNICSGNTLYRQILDTCAVWRNE